MINPLRLPLHWRLTLVMVVILTLLLIGTVMLVQRQSFRAALETTQRQNLGLAGYIASMQPRELIMRDGRVDDELIRALADSVRTINPALQIYLLDARGRVVAHALNQREPVRKQVGLSPIQALALPRIAAPGFPVLADDPLYPDQQGIFSAAALGTGTEPDGYLYLMFNTAGDAWTSASPTPDTLRAAALGMLAIILVMAAIAAWILRRLTRPLRRLTRTVQSIRTGEHPDAGQAGRNEIAILTDAIQSMQTRIAQQFASLENQDRLRRELISNVSHDLRTPLANMHGYLETLLLLEGEPAGQSGNASQRREFLEVALRQTQQCSARVDTLFELSQLDAGRVQPKLTPANLATVLQDTIAGYQIKARQDGVELTLVNRCTTDVIVLTDVVLLDRVMQNLLDNAIRHTPAGNGIEVSIGKGPNHYPDQEVIVAVTNHGEPINDADLAHVFERYWQGVNTPAAQATRYQRQQHSAGLGLAIVQRILTLLGSQPQVSSSARHGTRFEFALPAEHNQATKTV